jgi:hypothetical protein
MLACALSALQALWWVPTLALAERATVTLKSGQTLNGELTEYAPNDHATLVLDDGQQRVLPASELASVRLQTATSTEAARGPSPAPAPGAPTPVSASTGPLPLPEPPPPYAAEPSQLAGPSALGRLQLSVSAPLLRYTTTTRTFGGTSTFETSNVQWGLVRNANLELGYGVSSTFIFGAMAQLLGDSSSTDASSNSSFALFLAPKLDLQLDTAARFKVFFGVAPGIAFSSSDNDPGGSSSTGATHTSTTTFRAQARVGVRWFALEEASLDLSLVGGFEVGGGSVSAMNAALGIRNDADVDVSGGYVGLNLGMSVWPLLSRQ